MLKKIIGLFQKPQNKDFNAIHAELDYTVEKFNQSMNSYFNAVHAEQAARYEKERDDFEKLLREVMTL